MPFNTKALLASLDDNEQVYLVIRQHWFVLASRVIFWMLYLGVILFLNGLLQAMFPQLTGGSPGTIMNLILVAIMLHVCLGVFLTWAMYYLNAQIITNKRIVDIDQKGLLRNETSVLHLHKVEDVTTNIRGPLANLFGFGDVLVQTAGEKENFTFDAIAHPHDVAKIILELYEKVASNSGETGYAKTTTTPSVKSPPVL
ncbi:MAG: hypothetical protein A2722_04225 [Candidatus Doudnabacteria bacterium RIFCSPHIGHO2_01_FULL_50_11]|uniref:YdbS-like PH domain-containing protein n=1 Tax=Candidatus Doudnabacteria bacterium RIFCSPHIGHO2_01_FULL_50_11 TaxID=1817828 RepID=A0A1F5PG43_9BACT|nr:MAG: hypothetical protein A2722_04225 [Candidatus Doudnabacteria bacterium RIFCSPHIGHO2_01_FULL_50_11]HLC44926.1 PH domain-containing protein [Patescibacteria group bacterium]